jgi:hypothetical protein
MIGLRKIADPTRFWMSYQQNSEEKLPAAAGRRGQFSFEVARLFAHIPYFRESPQILC